MTGLSVIVAGRDPGRWRTALTLAAAHAALGGRTRLLLDGDAVVLVGAEPDLLDSGLALGVAVLLCQSGLAAAGLEVAMLDPRFEYGGMVGFLADLGDDRLVLV